MFKDVALKFALLTLNRFHTYCSDVSTVELIVDGPCFENKVLTFDNM